MHISSAVRLSRHQPAVQVGVLARVCAVFSQMAFFCSWLFSSEMVRNDVFSAQHAWRSLSRPTRLAAEKYSLPERIFCPQHGSPKAMCLGSKALVIPETIKMLRSDSRGSNLQDISTNCRVGFCAENFWPWWNWPIPLLIQLIWTLHRIEMGVEERDLERQTELFIFFRQGRSLESFVLFFKWWCCILWFFCDICVLCLRKGFREFWLVRGTRQELSLKQLTTKMLLKGFCGELSERDKTKKWPI